jgi:hypothetical protein
MTPSVSRLHSVDDRVINEYAAVGGLICALIFLSYVTGREGP